MTNRVPAWQVQALSSNYSTGGKRRRRRRRRRKRKKRRRRKAYVLFKKSKVIFKVSLHIWCVPGNVLNALQALLT
jgi:hypothetical protein